MTEVRFPYLKTAISSFKFIQNISRADASKLLVSALLAYIEIKQKGRIKSRGERTVQPIEQDKKTKYIYSHLASISLAFAGEAISMPDGREFAKALMDEVNGTVYCLPIIRNTYELLNTFVDETPDILIMSRKFFDDFTLSDNLLKFNLFKRNMIVFIVAENMANDARFKKFNIIDPNAGVCEVAVKILDKYAESLTERHSNTLDEIQKWMDNRLFFREVESAMKYEDGMLDAILTPLSLSSGLKGTLYLRQILSLLELGYEMTIDELYEFTALFNKTTKAAVEKAIRYAIEWAWTRGSIYSQYELFGNTLDENRGKPTNSEFIRMIAQHLKEKSRKLNGNLPLD